MMRCPEKCGKKWSRRKQTKPKWQKQEEREEQKKKRENEKNEKFRRLTTEEEMVIARMIEKKEEEREEEDLIELRTLEEMVPRWFHKYLKVFEKKELERMPTRKTWDYAIDFREGFIPKRGKIYPLS